MKTLYVVTAAGLETFVAWDLEGMEEGLRDLFNAQITDVKKHRNGDLKIEALDQYGYLPELTAEPHTEIYGEQNDD